MIKLLQKYNRWILVIFGGLLMIAFLLPQTLQMIGNDASAVTRIAVNGKFVTVRQLNDAAAKLKEVRSYAPGLATASNGEHWLMLNELTRRAGVAGNRIDGVAMIPEIASSAFDQNVQSLARSDMQRAVDMYGKRDEYVKGVERELQNRLPVRLTQGGEATFGDALAEARGLSRLINAFGNAPKLGEGRLIAAARKQFDEAVVSYILVTPDAKVLAEVGEVDQAAIDEHFAKFKDTPIGGGDLGIGYTFPDRVAVQYLTIDRNQIAMKVTVDPVEVQRRLLDIPADDKLPPDQRRVEVERIIRDEKIETVFKEAVATVRGELLKLSSALPEQDGYKTLPADGSFAAKADLKPIAEKAAAKIKKETGIELQINVSGSPTNLLTRTQFATMTGVGSANARVGTLTTSAADAVFGVRELRAPDSKERPRLVTQVAVPISASFEEQGRAAHFISIASAKRSAAAANVDEVRDQVIANIKRLRAFDKMQADMESWAINTGVLGFADWVGVLRASGFTVTEVKNDVRVSRQRGASPSETGVTDEAFTEAVMARAELIDPTQPIETTDATARTFAVATPTRQGVVVTQITQFSPLTVDRLRTELAARPGTPGNQGYEAFSVRSFTDAKVAGQQFIGIDAVIKRLKVKGLEKTAEGKGAAVE